MMRELKISFSYTTRAEHALNVYLGELDQLDLVTAEEEILLARKIRQGDRRALERLVHANLRFVVSCAKKYQNLGLPLADLVNEGNLGLIRAAKLFDETRGFKFISYAVWWIREAILKAIQVHGRMMRLSATTERILAEIRQAEERLEQTLEREPTLEEIAELVGLPEERISEEMGFGMRGYSLDRSMEEGESTLVDVLEDENAEAADVLVDTTQRQALEPYLALLEQRERKILEELYGLDGWFDVRTGRQVAKMNGLSNERVRQIAVDAIERIRGAVEAGKVARWYGD